MPTPASTLQCGVAYDASGLLKRHATLATSPLSSAGHDWELQHCVATGHAAAAAVVRRMDAAVVQHARKGAANL